MNAKCNRCKKDFDRTEASITFTYDHLKFDENKEVTGISKKRGILCFDCGRELGLTRDFN